MTPTTRTGLLFSEGEELLVVVGDGAENVDEDEEEFDEEMERDIEAEDVAENDGGVVAQVVRTWSSWRS